MRNEIIAIVILVIGLFLLGNLNITAELAGFSLNTCDPRNTPPAVIINYADILDIPTSFTEPSFFDRCSNVILIKNIPENVWNTIPANTIEGTPNIINKQQSYVDVISQGGTQRYNGDNIYAWKFNLFDYGVRAGGSGSPYQSYYGTTYYVMNVQSTAHSAVVGLQQLNYHIVFGSTCAGSLTCSEWSACGTNNMQLRTCNDGCGTVTTETRACNIPIPPPFDILEWINGSINWLTNLISGLFSWL